jgi:hypothetical protein
MQVVMPGHDDHVRARGAIRPVDDMQPSVVDVAEDGLGADHIGGAPMGMTRGEDVLDRATDGYHLGQRSTNAEGPQLADVVLARVLGVIGDERDLLLGGAELGHRLGRVPGALVTYPHASVEVEEYVVVTIEEGGERHQASNRVACSLEIGGARHSGPS